MTTTMTKPITFSNPRLVATFDDWPSGSKRVQCTFTMEYNAKRGYRFSRVTTGKPKVTTYSGKGAIVDGSDGRTYLIQQGTYNPAVIIWSSDFMCPDPKKIGREHYIPENDPYFRELVNLIAQANVGDPLR